MPNFEVKRIHKLQMQTEIFILPDSPAHDEALRKVSLHKH